MHNLCLCLCACLQSCFVFGHRSALASPPPMCNLYLLLSHFSFSSFSFSTESRRMRLPPCAVLLSSSLDPRFLLAPGAWNIAFPSSPQSVSCCQSTLEYGMLTFLLGQYGSRGKKWYYAYFLFVYVAKLNPFQPKYRKYEWRRNIRTGGGYW